jgi:signal transduction histidine kinase
MRLPALFKTTPFRLTLLFLALFSGAAAAFLLYIYVVTAGEVVRLTDAGIEREVLALEQVYSHGGDAALQQALGQREMSGEPFLYLLLDPNGRRLAGSIDRSPVGQFSERNSLWMRFAVPSRTPGGHADQRLARGMRQRLSGGEVLFVGADVSWAEAYVVKIIRALWGAAALVVLLGLVGGLLISRNVSRAIAGMTGVVSAVERGDLSARAPVRGAKDEFDDLAAGLNHMLERLERSIGGLRHAGDAIAHDLRSPLTRLRARLELALFDVEAGRGDPREALAQALDDTDNVLRTFAAVLAISKLQAAGEAPDQTVFDPSRLAADVAELYEPLCEARGLEFSAELSAGLQVRGNREFIAQALANVLDNAVKYTQPGGAVKLRVRRCATGDVEFSVTDTGPGVPLAERARVVERFVRLESSRNQPGVGLGLSLVAAVAEAHAGRLELDEGPGAVDGFGPGLRAALVLPTPA